MLRKTTQKTKHRGTLSSLAQVQPQWQEKESERKRGLYQEDFLHAAIRQVITNGVQMEETIEMLLQS